jgi:MSHA type pilus biogenesis protein MshL
MNMEIGQFRLALLTGLVLLGGCMTPKSFDASPAHIQREAEPVAEAPPAPVKAAPYLPPPRLAPPVPTYTVVVNDVPVRDLLFSIARDTKYNIDIYPGISGSVSLNAVNEPLPVILDRIARQADLRYSMDGHTIAIQPDTPFTKTYQVNYVNVARHTTSQTGVAVQIAATGGSTGSAATGGSVGQQGSAGNNSSTTITSTTNNDFWDVLTENLRAILISTRQASENIQQREERAESEKAMRAERIAQMDAVSKAGAGADKLFATAFKDNATENKYEVSVNPVAGTVTVSGTTRQHELVQQYLDKTGQAVRQQVLIEATIVEVGLKDQFHAGIDWTKLAQGTGWSILTGVLPKDQLAGALTPYYTIAYNNSNQDFRAAIKLLESFGNTRVLSSPKLMALNNQTALLKVVDNLVYFTITSDTNQTQGVSVTTYTSTPYTVPVGVVMSVTPQVGDNGNVTLTVRPTISRKVGEVTDPNPALAEQNIISSIPVIQVREMESFLQVRSGQTVILGGLIQDDSNDSRDGLPVLSRPKETGWIFGQQERVASQSELVIFLRPTIVADASMSSEALKPYQRLLPAAAAATP